jgi:hypothetical protein
MNDATSITQQTIQQFIEVATAHASTPVGLTEIMHEANQSRPALARLLTQIAAHGRETLAAQNSAKNHPVPRPHPPIGQSAAAPTQTPGGWRLSRHVIEQTALKGFSIEDVMETIDNPHDVNDNLLHPGQQRHMRDKICVVVDPATKSAITVFANWVATAPRADQTDAAALEYRRKYEAGLDRNGRERSA